MELKRLKGMVDERDTDYSSKSQHEGKILRTSVYYLVIILFRDYLRMFAYIHLLGICSGSGADESIRVRPSAMV